MASIWGLLQCFLRKGEKRVQNGSVSAAGKESKERKEPSEEREEEGGERTRTPG